MYCPKCGAKLLQAGTCYNCATVNWATPSGNAAGDGQLDPLDGPTLTLKMELALRAADEMARVCDDWVERGIIDARSALADARLKYGEPFEYKWSRPIVVLSDGGEKAKPKE